MNYRPEIDGLRALAVIPVVLYHAGIAGFTGGFIGVDVFFVISGFLITSLIIRDLRAGEFSLLHFWERRARRILPALSVMVIFVLVAGWFILLPGDYQDLGETAIAQSFFASNFVFWRQLGYFGPTASEVPLLHTWSLAVEEQFYLLFPLIMVALTVFVSRFRWHFVAIGVSLSFLLSLWAIDSHPSATFYLLPTRAWELGIGSLLAFWAVNRQNPIDRRIAEPASILGLVLILSTVFIYDEATQFPGIAALPPVLGTALVVWSNTAGRTRTGDLLAIKPLVSIGLISYSLYLWHWPLIVFTAYPTGSEDLSGIATTFAIGASVVFAYASWRFVETPFRKRRVLGTRRTIYSGSVAVLLMIGVFGILIRSDVGDQHRFSDEAQAFVQAEDSRSDRQKGCRVAESTGTELSDISSLCKYGDVAGDPAFVAWGDSHVGSLMPGLDLMANLSGVTGYHVSRTSCPPILYVEHREAGCARHNLSVRDLIHDQNIGSVVISGSWVGYQTDFDRLTPLSGSEFDPSSTDPRTVIVEGLAHTVRELMRAGKDVWLVRDIPRFEFDPPRRLLGASRFPSVLEDDGQPYSEYQTYQEPFDQIYEVLAAEGARVIDLPSVLCSDTVCPLTNSGTVLYRDSNHLTIEGSEFVSTAFRPIFENLLSSRVQ